MDINFELYKVFYHVANRLSFSEASHNLFISQSAVSQSIRLLEEKLGCKLFLRHTKQVKLTQEGEILYRHIEQAFHFIKTGERSLFDLHSLQRGEIRIAASDTICKYYLLPYFHQFNQLYPHIKIRITNRPSPVCIELLQKGMVDVSVANIPPQAEEYPNITMQKQKTIQDVFIAGKAFARLQHKTLELKELETYPLLMLENHTTTRRFFNSFLEKHNLRITPEIELGSIDLLIDLVKIGLGLSFVAKEYIQKELAGGDLFILDIGEPVAPRYWGVLTHDKMPVTPAVERFMALIAD
ncbi:transcription regulator hth lysr [Lucifera butyrica]|uniref:Transcription regulator hth lysr n=1 Tax=Lucifera butyrica TaxID=1351585 RepID=A0A498RB52_9FIRM|nr:LysR family transcriptional regulator [Lucifera butyrica]VBB06348.1 transcription regulator hth lysr [Lucifera butyrica]